MRDRLVLHVEIAEDHSWDQSGAITDAHNFVGVLKGGIYCKARFIVPF